MLNLKPRTIRRYIRRMAVDVVLIPFAFYLALLIRFDGHCTKEDLQVLSRFILPIIFTYVIINLAFGVYRRLWTYASFRDVIRLTETIGFGTLLLVAVNVYLLSGYEGRRLPTGCIVIGGLLTLVLSSVVKYRRQLLAIVVASRSKRPDSTRERVLIVGINEIAQQLATQMYLGNSQMNYELVGFVDDDPDGQGMSVNGVEILGTQDLIPVIVHDEEIDVIVIAHQPTDREDRWKLISTCQETPAQVKILPDIVAVMQGGYRDPLTLRDVTIDDILGRTSASVCSESCRDVLEDKIVLVTGAAGSIGSELCRQILSFKPRLLLALDNNETGLYELNLEINRSGQLPVRPVLADVTNWHAIRKVFQQYGPQVVFHAAAYKHVPILEHYPHEALRVNVLGTVIMGDMARKHKAERFVFVSTDKAVKPSSVMGISKRIGELWVESLARCSDGVFTAVRFGNVVGSRGSVLPTFSRQIELGGPVTVTHPEMTRFFMSIPEAVSLVLQSAAFSHSGEILMLEMGEEVSILSLAERMIRLKGLRVHKDIAIKFIGIRPGEKLHEELVYDQEFRENTPHPSIYRLSCPKDWLDRETLLGALTILLQTFWMEWDEQHLREGMLQIISGDIDGFLNRVAGIDLLRDWRPKREAAERGQRWEKIVQVAPSRMADGVLTASSLGK